MKCLLILTTPPFGSKITFLGIKKAVELIENKNEVTIFLYSDGVYNALSEISPTEKEFNPLSLLENFSKIGGKILFCTSAGARRGVSKNNIANFVQESSLAEASFLVSSSDLVLSY